MKTKETMGITIISLVITIIILLILSGVTISIIVGENGILTKARLAKQMSEVSSEKEAIQLDVTLANMENILDNTKQIYLGIPLYDKTLENEISGILLLKMKARQYMEQVGIILKKKQKLQIMEKHNMVG